MNQLLRELSYWISGENHSINSQHRIFNGLVFSIILFDAIFLVFNALIDPYLVILFTCSLIVNTLFYITVRVKFYYNKLLVYSFIIFNFIHQVFIFFMNDGFEGPMIYILLFTVFLNFLILKPNRFFFVTFLQLIFFFVCCMIEFSYPNSVTYNYETSIEKFVNHFGAIFSITLTSSLLLKWLKFYPLLFISDFEEDIDEEVISFNEVIENLEDIVFVVNTECKIQFLSPSWGKQLGYQNQKCIGKSFTDFVAPEDRDRWTEYFRNTIIGKSKGLHFEMHLLTIKGKRRLHTISGSITKKLNFLGVSQDTTLQKIYDDEAEFINKSLNSLMDNSLDVIYILDQEYKYLAFNKSHKDDMLKNYGVQIEKGVSILSYLKKHGDDVLARKDIKRVMNGGGYIIQRTFRENIGEKRHLEFSYAPVKVKDKSVGVIVIVRDITKRVEMELAVKNANLQLNSLIDSANALIYSIDKNFKFIKGNANFVKFVKDHFDLELYQGFEVNNEENEDLKNIFLKIVDYFERALKGEVIIIEELVDWGVYKGKYFESTYYPIWGPENTITGVSVYSADVTSRKLHEDQIKKLNENLEQKVEERTKEVIEGRKYLELALKTAKISVWTWTYKRGFYWDKSMYQILGIDQEEFSFNDSDFRKLIYPHDFRRMKSLYWKILKGEFSGEFEEIITIHNKETKKINYIKILGKIEREENNPIVYAVAWDVTNAQIFERQLQVAKDKAEASSKAKTTFLANISHEMRSPLNAIVGFSNLLLSTGENDKIEREYLEQLNHIKTSGENLSELINSILDLSKIEAGKLTINKESVDMRKLLKEVEHVYKEYARQKGIFTQYQITDDFPAFIMTDKNIIRQILNNLISNALKFTHFDGDIKVCIDKEGERSWKISVGDNGIGIPASKREHIFDAFEQVDNSTTRKHGGTGLGLAIIKKMTNLLHGKLYLESELNVGTKFEISFPLTLAKLNSDDNKKLKLSEYRFSKQSKVLVVEDNKMNQLMLQKVFKEVGIDIELAKDGKEGLEKALSLSPSLILMDMHMPELDGLEVTKMIRNNKTIKQMPIVAVSANAFIEQQRKAYLAGINDYVTKPIDLDKLLNVLMKYLKREGENGHENGELKLLSSEMNAQVEILINELLNQSFKDKSTLISKIQTMRSWIDSYDTGYIKLLDMLQDAVLEDDISKFKGESL